MGELIMKCYEQLEQMHFNCLQGMYFSKIHPSESSTILLSDKIEDTYYNYCALMQFHKDEFKEYWINAKKMFPSNRVPALYVTPSSNLYGQERNFLQSFKKQYTDSWMVMQSGKYLCDLKIDKKIEIKRIETQEDFKQLFVETFQSAYSGDDPSDPYGQLSPTYKESLLDSWDRNLEYKKDHYLAFYEGTPAGVLTAISYQELVGVYNVGTVPQFRCHGLGESLMATVAQQLNNHQILFLQTEKGSHVEKWYGKMGFETLFYGECYTE